MFGMHLAQSTGKFWLRQEGYLDAGISTPIIPVPLAMTLALLKALNKLVL
ncbi:hypothetical protein C8K66_101340 [Pseudomonas sp. GV105]|nr:hypothetical protein C8K66_101340 [Pseudomonas sp. GV105]